MKPLPRIVPLFVSVPPLVATRLSSSWIVPLLLMPPDAVTAAVPEIVTSRPEVFVMVVTAVNDPVSIASVLKFVIDVATNTSPPLTVSGASIVRDDDEVLSRRSAPGCDRPEQRIQERVG